MVPATYVEEIATYDDPTDDQSFSSESEGKKSNMNEHGPRDEPDGEPDLGNEEYEDSWVYGVSWWRRICDILYV